MTMRASTRERILKTAYANPLGLLRLNDLSTDEIRQAAGSQPMDDCRKHGLSRTLFRTAERLAGLASDVQRAESYWIELNR